MVALTEKKTSRTEVTIHKITAKPAVGLTILRHLRGSESNIRTQAPKTPSLLKLQNEEKFKDFK